MSRAPLENVHITETNIGLGAGGHQYLPQSMPTQAPQGISNFVDGSGPIFSMYLEMATEEDKKMVEGWKADADGILIFTGLFSAAVASLISVSVQDIRQNPQDTSNFYLANIYQTLSNPNASSSLPAFPPPFSPPNCAVWVNALWFMSLAISLTCALLATLLQQWARRYFKVTHPRYGPHKRARIRAFFFNGVEKFLLPWAVEAMPTLLHISLFLFFAGLAVFLCNVDLTIFKFVLSWVGVCTALYGCITFVPIFCPDSPYHTPLSLPAWHIVAGISFVTLRALRWFTFSTILCFPCFCFGPFSLLRFTGEAYEYFESLEESYRKLLMQGMQRAVEESALNSPSEINTRAFLWTFDCLDEDHELERFFSGLPSFRSSKVVNDPLPSLTEKEKWDLFTALIGLLDRTLSSDLLPDPIKDRRAIICTKAISPAEIPNAYQWILNRIVYGDRHKGLRLAEFSHIVRGWADSLSGDRGTALVVQAILTGIVAMAQWRNDSWFIFASDELGIQRSVLRGYAAKGDSLSLAVLIHIIRRQFDHFWEPSWPSVEISFILETASKFNGQDTSPELQHEFCALWNQIVLKAQNDGDRSMAFQILRPIRNVYIALHKDTDAAPTSFSATTSAREQILFSPTSYPLCNVPGHHPDSTTHTHDDSASTTLACATPHNNAALASTSSANPDPPSSSVPASCCVDESLTDVSPLDNFHPAHQTTIEGLHIPITSPEPATAGAKRDIVTSGRTIPRPTPKTSISAPPLSSTSPPAAVSLQHNAGALTPSDLPNFRSSTSSHPVLDDKLPKDSRRSIVATTSLSAYLGPTSAPDPGAAAEDDGSPDPGLRKEADTLGPHSANRAVHPNTFVTLDLPPQSPSLPLVTESGVAVASASFKEPNAERTGYHPPDPLHGMHEIV